MLTPVAFALVICLARILGHETVCEWKVLRQFPTEDACNEYKSTLKGFEDNVPRCQPVRGG